MMAVVMRFPSFSRSDPSAMRPVRALIATALALVATCGVGTSASAGDKVNRPPIANQPVDFGGAIGSFKISMRATPRELRAEDSLLLPVRIVGRGNWHELERPNLRKNRSFARDFEVNVLRERS